ncbi:hypothetical protein JL720_6046 [Aureococcus anophagefferens]|nr:hypothetical protein JL720_6046 [Aureococcus anophagefferens]
MDHKKKKKSTKIFPDDTSDSSSEDEASPDTQESRRDTQETRRASLPRQPAKASPSPPREPPRQPAKASPSPRHPPSPPKRAAPASSAKKKKKRLEVAPSRPRTNGWVCKHCGEPHEGEKAALPICPARSASPRTARASRRARSGPRGARAPGGATPARDAKARRGAAEAAAAAALAEEARRDLSRTREELLDKEELAQALVQSENNKMSQLDELKEREAAMAEKLAALEAENKKLKAAPPRTSPGSRPFDFGSAGL